MDILPLSHKTVLLSENGERRERVKRENFTFHFSLISQHPHENRIMARLVIVALPVV
jgi:hypothetical protein